MPLSAPFTPPINGFNLDVTDFVSSTSIALQATLPFGVASTKQDKKIFILDVGSNTIFEYNNSFCNVSSMEFSGNVLDLSPTGALSVSLRFSLDEKRLYVINVLNDFVFQYNLPFPGTIKNAYYSGLSLFVGAQTTGPIGVSISDNDTKIYVSSGPPSTIFQYNLSDILDIGSGVFVAPLDISAVSTNPIGQTLDNDGTKIIVPNATDRSLFRYDLTSPHNVSSGVLSSISFNGEPYAPPGPVVNSIAFTGTSGKNMYMTDLFTDNVYQYISHTLKAKCP